MADAKSRLAAAERQLGDAVIRAPLTGIVSRRTVNQGDVVSVGTELFTMIDPSSMRLEASVPSEDLSALKVGAVVDFTVRGYEQTFQGKIERIAPQADPTTRQVRIYVTIPNAGGRLVAGLFAEGRVVNQAATGLILPQSAVNIDSNEAWVLRVTDGKTERAPVTVGPDGPANRTRSADLRRVRFGRRAARVVPQHSAWDAGASAGRTIGSSGVLRCTSPT